MDSTENSLVNTVPLGDHLEVAAFVSRVSTEIRLVVEGSAKSLNGSDPRLSFPLRIERKESANFRDPFTAVGQSRKNNANVGTNARKLSSDSRGVPLEFSI